MTITAATPKMMPKLVRMLRSLCSVRLCMPSRSVSRRKVMSLLLSYTVEDQAVAQIEILSERECRNGWEFDAQVLDDSGELRRCRIALSWADYNLWSPDGADEPVKVTEAVLTFMLARAGAAGVPQKFDAS